MVKNPPANAGDVRDMVQSLGLEDPLEKEMATLQYSCLENAMDSRGAQWATAHEVAELDMTEAN